MFSNIIVFLLVVVLVYIWRRRELYYYSLYFPGPFTLPFIMTTFKLITSLHKDIYKTFVQLCESQPPIFKLWIANDLYVVNSQPEDVEILLNTCLEKNRFYKLYDYFVGRNILTSPVSVWKPRRREENRCFNQQIISSFHNVFVKRSKEMVKILYTTCGQEETNLLPKIWKCTLDIAAETLLGVDPTFFEDLYDTVPLVTRTEQIIVERFKENLLFNDLIFRFPFFERQASEVFEFCRNTGDKILKKKKQQMNAGAVDELGSKRFLNHLIDLSDQGKNITETEVIHESVTMMVAASETTSATVNFAVLILGLFPEIQNRIYEEIGSLSLENINRMDYLERVIKETMRLLPVVPFISRSIEKDIKTGSFVYPAGSNLIIPIWHIHKRPDLWPDPSKFDPDRFLPEEVAKRHRCAYIPFSFGSRNCIGWKYGMLSMKVMLAYIVKHFTVKALNYRSVEEIKIEWHIMSKPKEYRIKFEKRTTWIDNFYFMYSFSF